MGSCAFDKLFAKSVPHILEKIFFSLDYKSFKKCQEVSITWNQLLTSESFRKIEKSVFREDIEEDLLGAIEEDNVDEVRRILSNGVVDVNCEINMKLRWDQFCYSSNQKERIETPLFYAARMGQKDVVQLLIEKGADPNWQHLNEWTPLHMAAGKCHPDVVRMLLNAGADPNRVGRWGYTALRCIPTYALCFRSQSLCFRSQTHKKIANILRDAGAL